MGIEHDFSFQDFNEWLKSHAPRKCTNCGADTFLPNDTIAVDSVVGEMVPRQKRAYLTHECKNCGFTYFFNLARVQQSIIRERSE